MVGAQPPSGGIESAFALAGAWSAQLTTTGGVWAALLGLGTVAILVGWDRYRPARLAKLPGPLLAVEIATVAAAVFGIPVATVELPASLAASLTCPRCRTEVS